MDTSLVSPKAPLDETGLPENAGSIKEVVDWGPLREKKPIPAPRP